MKIAMVTTQFAETGGVENVVESITEEFSEDHEIHLVTRERAQNTEDLPEIFEEVHVLPDTESYLNYLKTGRKFFRSNRGEFDVFHFHNWSTILPAAGLDIPSVLTTHGTTFDVQASEKNYLKAGFYWLVEEILFNLPDRMTSVTRSHLKPFWIGKPVEIIRNGVDTEKYSLGDAEEKSDKFEILIVGKHVPAKNHSLLIEAASEFENLKLLIPSEGPLTDQLKKQAQELDVDAEFLGRVPEEQLVQLYRRADLFCLPSENEGLPLSMLEAISCGTPVLVSDVGDNTEVVAEASAGAVLKDSTPDNVFSGLRNTKEQDLEKMSFSAREYSIENLDWERIAQQYNEAYSSVHG
jgi:glycosyltransferase involved in cell wall biosynthesis